MNNKLKGIVRSILKHKGWPGRIYPTLFLEYYGREGRQRIEVMREANDVVRAYLLSIRVRCAACGEIIHPFRCRVPSKRGNKAGLYYAASCATRDNYACSRSKATADEYARVVAALEERDVRPANA